MRDCIYCGKHPATSSEHILQDSLGSEWERKNILCDTCNNLFGRTIDSTLATEFQFFRNYLSIRGKHKKIPALHLTNENGEKITRNGQTGEITTSARPEFEKLTNPDGSYSLSVKTEVAKTKHILDDISKGAKRKGEKIGPPSTSGYTAQTTGQLHSKLSISLPTYVALRKSLINYWSHLRHDQETEAIIIEAKKIHDFAQFCDKNKCNDGRAKYASGLGINGLPLSVEIPTTAKEIMQRKSDLSNSLFLIPIGKELYGGVCIFNEIQWGFKIADNTTMTAPLITSIDVATGKVTCKHDAFEELSSNSFKFMKLGHKEHMEKLKKEVSNLMQLCAAIEHHTSIKSILEPGDLENFFPLKERDTIEGIFLERAAMILGYEFVSHGIPPEFFKSEQGIQITQTIVAEFIKNMEQNSALTSKTYSHFIAWSIHAAQSYSKNREIVKMIKTSCS